MCRLCDGNPPDSTDFYSFRTKVLEARRNVDSFDEFLKNAIVLDKMRFVTGAEWGEPNIGRSVLKHIFRNPSPEVGFLLFVLCCWLDMQAPYTKVWSTYLRQASDWLTNDGSIPRGGFFPTASHLQLTRRTAQKLGGIDSWLSQVLIGVARRNGRNPGNLYRFAGEVCNDLYSKKEMAGNLKMGWLPPDFSGGDHKRFWMFMMFLRRDESIIRCLLTRALNRIVDGKEALGYWHDEAYYDPKECELPVDTHVLENWNAVMSRIGMQNMCGRNRRDVAVHARRIAQEHGISPSAFDAILFF